jgi:hypothetical protein
MPLFGPPDVEKLKAKGDIGGLARTLQGFNKKAPVAAAYVLGEIRDPRVIEPLSDTRARQGRS